MEVGICNVVISHADIYSCVVFTADSICSLTYYGH